MKTEDHHMKAAKCEACGADGPLSLDDHGAQVLARALDWAEEQGVTRCPPCREDRKR